MKYHYNLLKASWGISIFIDIDPLVNEQFCEDDIRLYGNIALRIDESVVYLREDIILYTIISLKSIEQRLQRAIEAHSVCYYIKSIDFSDVDFQIEGIYGAVRGWLNKYYALNLEAEKVYYDKSTNKYIYDIPQDLFDA